MGLKKYLENNAGEAFSIHGDKIGEKPGEISVNCVELRELRDRESVEKDILLLTQREEKKE